MSTNDRGADLPALRRTAGESIPSLGIYQQRLLMAGGAATLVCCIGLLFSPRQFFQSYLVAYLFVLGLTLGSLALAMIHQLAGGLWGVVIRRTLGAASRTLPVVSLLFLPIVFGMHYLYPWTDSAAVARDAALQWKRPYLNVPFFLARAVIYFGAWNLIGHFLNRWSLEQDASGDANLGRRMQSLSAAGLVVYGITITFASFDWVMSIDPHWYSTIFGVLIMGSQGLSGLAFAIVALEWLGRRPPLVWVVKPAHFHDLGNLLLAFVLLWAYFAFSQYLIIWSGNLPEEIEWYVRREGGGWRAVALAIVVLHFGVPFLLLLSRALKRDSRFLARIALLLLALRVVDLLWLIAPASGRVSVLDVMLPAALATLWLGLFVWQVRDRALLPMHDPEFTAVIGALPAQPDGAR